MTGHVQANKEMIEKTLSSDPLFTSLLLDKEYNGRLYSESVLSLEPNKMYSTTECSESIFHIANSTLRYYVRMLDGYLEVFIEGRKKRLPYISVFKIHMVLLAIERGETISDIQVKLALKSQTQQKIGQTKGNKYNDENLDQIFIEFERRQQILVETFMRQNGVTQLEMDLLKKETSVTDKKRQIEIIQEKIKSHRLYRKMDRQAGNVLRKSLELNRKSSGILSIFSKKQEYNPNVENEILVDEREIKADNLEGQYNGQIEKLENEIGEAVEEIILLKQRLLTEQQRLSNERVYLEEDLDE
ncbi:hypothetical protein [Bacillus sp. MUM 13]|uniref:hypothetical protein n=1 Tax=Bacillus sp. MUM 13 TaxID=1678001 RepID=UPI0008F5E1DB|nr:hypothetical protein [Bacillus sp. MUM 13]OIK03930.1 hypothetical protein BIV59_22360 [Bacillus sp. MUM 13]